MNESDLIGKVLTHYRIVERIAEGGMGVVFRAHDLRLHRMVALKLLPLSRAVNVTARERFRREALILARLNHPHIAAIYDLGSDQDLDFLVMELVSGLTLAQKVRHGPLPESEALALGEQITAALDAAHAAHVVHRDLKPANIIVTPGGQIKILDFGLAKILEGADAPTESLTESGHVVGTLPYMAPEQLYRDSLDPTVDLYALGAVLYELVTGRRPFTGSDRPRLTDAILYEPPPPPRRVNPRLSAQFEALILRALEKDRSRRYQSARELQAELKRISGTRGAKHRWVLGLILIAAGLSFVILRNPMESRHSHPGEVPTSKQATFVGSVLEAVLSPDGEFIAYVGRSGGQDRILVQDRAGGLPVEILRQYQCRSLRWAADGRSILAFVTDSLARSKMVLVPRLGGDPQPLKVGGSFGGMSKDGSRVAASYLSSKSVFVTELDSDHVSRIQPTWPFLGIVDLDWSPRSDDLVVLTRDSTGWYSLWNVSPDGKRQQPVLRDSVIIHSPRWSPVENAIYYLRERDLVTDLHKVELGRRRKPKITLVLSGLQSTGPITITGDGRQILYLRSAEHSNIWAVRRRAVGRPEYDLDAEQLTSGTRWDVTPSLSPDGRQVAFARAEHGADIFQVPIGGGPVLQLTFLKANLFAPVWSPDGSQLAFILRGKDKWGIWKMQPGKAPQPFPKIRHSGSPLGLAWAPGHKLVYETPGNQAIHILDPGSGSDSPLESDTSSWIFCGRPAPSGATVAAFWNRHRYPGIWLLSPDTRKMLYPVASPLFPIRWSKDGSCIYALDYYSEPQRVWTISVPNGDAKVWFTMPFSGKARGIDASEDGSLFVCGVVSTESDAWIVDNFDPRIPAQAASTRSRRPPPESRIGRPYQGRAYRDSRDASIGDSRNY